MVRLSVPAEEILATRCRAAGLKATPQRLAIYRALLESEDHPGPDALFGALRPKLPTLSLATVYKVLNSLHQAGLIGRVSRRGETKRYDGNLAAHQHLVCTVCEAIFDLKDPSLDLLQAPAHLDGFSAQEVKVEILGVCKNCKTQHGSVARKRVAGDRHKRGRN